VLQASVNAEMLLFLWEGELMRQLETQKKPFILNLTTYFGNLSDRMFYLLLIAPASIVFLLLSVYPLLNTIWMSFTFNRPSQPFIKHHFVGLNNFKYILTEDNLFWISLKNTLYFTVSSVLLELLIGLSAALLINRSLRGIGLFRVALLIPWTIPTVVAAMMFNLMYNDVYGVFNDLLYKLGVIDSYHPWLADVNTSLNAIILAEVWKTFPFMTLIILAGLQAIPKDLYEAAYIDRATRWQTFRYIVLPHIKGAILVALLFRTIDSLRAFDLIYILTKGGPADSTQVLLTDVYKQTFEFLHYDRGAAISVIVFLIVLICSLIYALALLKSED
jgi:ABC-type sugar transport system permease subunit